MNKRSQIFGDPKQGLRDILARIIRDFDSKCGAFAGLKYNSPWILATEDWAERSGHTVEELCEMISQWRISVRSGNPMNPRIVRIFEDLRNAAEEWRAETGYYDPPTHLTPEMTKFPNREELKAHTLKAWSSLGLVRQWHNYDARDLGFRGIFEDVFGHRVTVGMTIKLGYGGPIWLYFRFPYYANDEPTSFHHPILSGSGICDALRLPRVPELEWIASKSKTSFTEVESVLARATLTYLRPTIQ
ncbi:MAG: hypothetical protein E5W70_29745 [Mesorhizobium sp.]|uniref:hypothetical protein n=1 Tax=Mesorhizobium sp. TaxID=1871066 RepID=UPI0012038941|nr:hypothetical protein [Mesorhizobium sp.]TIT18286.1 MAG: hypothetical protein E5W70_29745 [Mesorhizobium sp.]